MLLRGRCTTLLVSEFTMHRPDADESNLKASAYEAINEFIQSAENWECKQVVKDLVPVFQSRLENTFKAQVEESYYCVVAITYPI
jgi:hypothetical protein